MEKLPFIPGKSYVRSQIHDQFKGNRQSGISVSRIAPYIFIFSGSTGHQHGYKDQWENDDIFSYTGEGQNGDMQFVRGNLALKDHLKNGRRIFLFVYTHRGLVSFHSELELEDFDFFLGPDTTGKERLAIKFFFKRKGVRLHYEPELSSTVVAEDFKALFQRNVPNVTEREGLVVSRVGQGAYRKSILYRWDYKCAVTNYSKKEILIASHIVPWKNATNDERLDVDNGILLSPTYDALFDQHLISFENTGRIILSKSLAQTNYEEIGVTGKEHIKAFSTFNHSYLERHRCLLRD